MRALRKNLNILTLIRKNLDAKKKIIALFENKLKEKEREIDIK